MNFDNNEPRGLLKLYIFNNNIDTKWLLLLRFNNFWLKVFPNK
jgi:hypothetical protein